jgi:hypothetical protein
MKSHRLRTVGILAAGLVALLVATSVTNASGTFAPTVTMETSSTRATAHPDARITVDNTASSENIKDLTLNMPSGFWGSLAAVSAKCSQANAEAGNCGAGSKIGTVTATATIDDGDTHAIGVLSGGVYMTDAFDDGSPTGPTGTNPVSLDPAGISIIVDAKVGAVNLGKVIVHGRAIARNTKLTSPTTPTGAVGPPEGITTLVVDIPDSITDAAHGNRSVSYLVKQMQIDLKSDLDGPNPPLLTNPSKCSTAELTGEATSTSDVTVQVSDEYTVGQCDTAKFQPTADLELTNPAADDVTGMLGEIDFGDDSSSVSSIVSVLPPAVGPNYPAFGAAADRCSGAVPFDPSGQSELGTIFNPTTCPVQAKFGRVTVESPLVPDPLVGDIYLINKTPLPWLGIDISPKSDPSNPKGVTIRMLGKTNLVQVDPSCNTGFCQKQVTVEFRNSPDAPVKKIYLDLDRPDRWDPTPGAWLSSKLLAVASSGSSECIEAGDIPLVMSNNSGTDDGVAVSQQNFTGCGATPPIAVTSGVADGTPGSGRTTDRTPSFNFTYSGSENLKCAVDAFQTTAVACSPPTYNYSGSDLANGIHTVYVAEETGGQYLAVRRFVVENDAALLDSTDPETSLNSVPSITADATPSFTYHATASTGTNEFQCSIDDGAFLPCGSATDSDDQVFTVAAADAFEASTVMHSFAVRAQDAAGNVDQTPATASFEVDIPFAPTTTIVRDTDAARAHPEMTVTIKNLSHEDIEQYTLKMPDGLFGALTGVVAPCTTADMNNGDCDAGSKIGTVTAKAVIDRSTVTTSGSVYLTDPQAVGDPAGIAVVVKPKLQGVEFKPIVVMARMIVRDGGQGIDALAIDIPNTAESVYDEESAFDMRELVMHLESNPSASQPLLTNPSGCEDKAFTAEYTGYGNSETSYPIPFSTTACSALAFAPQLSITQKDSYSGSTTPANSSPAKRVNVDFNASLTTDPNGAGIKQVNLILPKALTIDVGHLPYPCMPDEAAAKLCPASSAIGTVSAITPLLPEPLTGTVYVLKSLTSLPRMLIALRGRINVDLIATNSFVNVNQIVTSFDTLPDAPLSSMTMTVNKFLMTREEACETTPDSWNIIGTIGGFNGASSPVNIPLGFDCPAAFSPTYKNKFKNSKTRSTLSMSIKAQSGKSFKKLRIKLPKGVKFNSKAMSKKKIGKYVTVKSSGKKLKTKCFKKRSSTVFEINFCGKRATSVSVSFRKGSLVSKTKKKNLKFGVSVFDTKWTNAVDVG